MRSECDNAASECERRKLRPMLGSASGLWPTQLEKSGNCHFCRAPRDSQGRSGKIVVIQALRKRPARRAKIRGTRFKHPSKHFFATSRLETCSTTPRPHQKRDERVPRAAI